jgi:hypothetical protein
VQRSYVSAVVQLSTGAGIAVGNVLAEATGKEVRDERFSICICVFILCSGGVCVCMYLCVCVCVCVAGV